MSDKAASKMGWVVQVMTDPPDLDDVPSFAYFQVAIADPKKAVQAVAKHTAPTSVMFVTSWRYRPMM